MEIKTRKSAGLWLAVLLFAFLPVVAAGCGKSPQQAVPESNSQERELLVSAAASLQEALQEIEQVYRQENPGVRLIFNFGSSGTLQRQIEQGAPVDLFLSAAQKQMDELERQGLILPDTRLDLLRNELALITGKDNDTVTGVADLTKEVVATVAVGVPETVPAGQYAKEALQNLRLWDALQDKMVSAKDVKQVLTYVETGNADAGFVYLSDAVGSAKVRIVEVLPAELYEPVVYPAAIVKAAPNPEGAQAFLAYLNGPKAGEIFAKYGFKPAKGGE